MAWQTTHPSLLVRLRNSSDHASWTEFDRRYGDLILRYCLGRGLQLTDAEDVRQEVFVILSRRLHAFEYAPERGRFRSYLGRIVHNAVTHNATRPYRRREALCGEDTAFPDLEAAPKDDAWERAWADHHLRTAMRTVRRTFDPRSVEAFEHFLAGRSAEAVARRTGLTPGAANKVKQRIRDRLRQLVARQITWEDATVERPTPR